MSRSAISLRQRRLPTRKVPAFEFLERRLLMAVDCGARPDHPKCTDGGGDGGDGGSGGITNPAWAVTQNGEIHLRSSDGLAAEKLASGGKEDLFAPAWSPDGSKIAYFEEQLSGRRSTIWTDVWMMNQDGSQPELVYQFDAWSEPVPHRSFRMFWIPETGAPHGGSKLLYSGNSPRDACILDLEKAASGDPQPNHCLGLDDLSLGDVRAVSLGPVAPNGDFSIAFVGGGDIHIAGVTSNTDGSYSVDLGDVESLSLEDPQGLPVWSPDGTSIAFVNHASFDGGDELQLAQIDNSSGTPHFTNQITTLYIGSSGLGHIAGQPTWAPNGDKIAFSATSDHNGSGWNWDIFVVDRAADATDPANPHLPVNMTNDNIDERQPVWNPNWVDDVSGALRAESMGTDTNAAPVTLGRVRPLLNVASSYWAGHGATLHHLPDVRIEDLPGTVLGMASDDTIWIDQDAAGHGWATAESDGFDLLAVVTHEVGHVLDYDHSHDETELMASHLPVGTRRLPTLLPQYMSVALITDMAILSDRGDGALLWSSLLPGSKTELDQLEEDLVSGHGQDQSAVPTVDLPRTVPTRSSAQVDVVLDEDDEDRDRVELVDESLLELLADDLASI